jgi:hypothetical protein
MGSIGKKAAAKVQAWADQNQAEGGVCDFCTHHLIPDTATTYRVDREIVRSIMAPDGSIVTQVLSPDWGACERCTPVIDEGDPAKLMEHVLVARKGGTYDRGMTNVPRDLRARLEKITRRDLLDLYGEWFTLHPRKVEWP